MPLIILFYMILSLLHASGAPKPEKVDLKKLSYLRYCEVWSYDQTLIHNFPGNYCLFLDDGRFIAAEKNGIAMYDANQVQVWSRAGHFHHQINWADGRKYVLALKSDLVQEKDKKIRRDVVVKIDLDGKIVSENNSESMMSEAQSKEMNLQKPSLFPVVWTTHPDFDNKSFERSHFNSIYEIPDNALSKKNPAFKEGNVIVNNVNGQTYILSGNLDQVLFTRTIPGARLTHDMQVTKSGDFLFFNNFNVDEKGHPPQEGPYSSVDQINPLTGKIVYKFTAEPKQLFFSWCCGGVQEIDHDTLLISHVISGMYIVNRKTKKIIKYNTKVSGVDDPNYRAVQQYRAFDLTKFLSIWGF